ncbi:hypothetical protein D3C85_1139320 [compost metagenome]
MDRMALKPCTRSWSCGSHFISCSTLSRLSGALSCSSSEQAFMPRRSLRVCVATPYSISAACCFWPFFAIATA